MIHVTFPDGAERAYEPEFPVSKSPNPSLPLAKRSVAMVRNGELADLATLSTATRRSSSLAATIEGAPSYPPTPPTFSRKRCSRSGLERRSPSVR